MKNVKIFHVIGGIKSLIFKGPLGLGGLFFFIV